MSTTLHLQAPVPTSAVFSFLVLVLPGFTHKRQVVWATMAAKPFDDMRTRQAAFSFDQRTRRSDDRCSSVHRWVASVHDPSVRPQSGEMMFRIVAFALALSGLCLCSPLRADEAEKRAVAFVKNLRGTGTRDAEAPGEPVVTMSHPRWQTQ